MPNYLVDFWGKCSQGKLYPAVYHMMDVALVAQAIIARLAPVERDRLLAPFAHCVQPLSVCAWIIALHDIGKITPSFQYKNIGVALTFCQTTFAPALSEHHHGYEGLVILAQWLIDQVKMSNNAARVLATAVVSHHGRFEWQYDAQVRGYSANWIQAQHDSLHWLAQAWAIEPQALDIDESALTCTWLMQMSGLCAVADWLASNEAFFPYTVTDYDQARKARRSQAEQVVHSLGIKGQSLRLKGAIDCARWFGFTASAQQQYVIDRLTQADNPGLIILEIPMGWGKTELALMAYYHLAHTYQRQGLYFALPTQSTSNQMLQRVERFLQQVVADQGINLQLCHGGSALNDDLQRLLVSAVYDDDTAPAVSANQWFVNTKRCLLAEAAVGTVDQALMACMQTKHQFVRLFGLSNKVLVLDEAHCYPDYTDKLMAELLTWLGQMRSPVILLSATLAHSKRQKFIQAYLGQTAVTLAPQPYPRLTLVSQPTAAGDQPIIEHSTIFLAQDDPQQAHKPRLWIKLHPGPPRHWPQAMAELSIELYQQGANVACIANTVSQAQHLYDLIQAQLNDTAAVSLYHARYPEYQRAQIEQRLTQQWGKCRTQPQQPNPQRPQRHIVVCSSLFGESIDVCCDVMLSEITEMPLLLQRAGRLHRHAHNQPLRAPAVRQPWLHLFLPPMDTASSDANQWFGAANVHLYQPAVLYRTCSQLSQCAQDHTLSVSLPAGIDEQVQAVYADPFIDPFDNGFDLAAADHLATLGSVTQQAMAADQLLRYSPTARRVCSNHGRLEEGMSLMTRLSPRSITLVLGHDQRQSDTQVLLAGSEQPIDLRAKPGLAQLKAIKQASLRLALAKWVHYFIESGHRYRPPAWESVALLHDHYLLWLDENDCLKVKGTGCLHWHRVKGLMVDS